MEKIPILAALIFGGIDAFQLRLQAAGMRLPYQYLLLLPYLVTIVLLVAISSTPRISGRF